MRAISQRANKIRTKIYQVVLPLILLFVPFVGYAVEDINTNLSTNSGSSGIGEVADQFVSGPLEGLKHLMTGLCYIVGVILLIIAIHKFQLYRRNPQEMPLSHAIMYILAAVIIILLPLTYYLVKMAGS